MISSTLFFHVVILFSLFLGSVNKSSAVPRRLPPSCSPCRRHRHSPALALEASKTLLFSDSETEERTDGVPSCGSLRSGMGMDYHSMEFTPCRSSFAPSPSTTIPEEPTEGTLFLGDGNGAADCSVGVVSIDKGFGATVEGAEGPVALLIGCPPSWEAEDPSEGVHQALNGSSSSAAFREKGDSDRLLLGKPALVVEALPDLSSTGELTPRDVALPGEVPVRSAETDVRVPGVDSPSSKPESSFSLAAVDSASTGAVPVKTPPDRKRPPGLLGGSVDSEQSTRSQSVLGAVGRSPAMINPKMPLPIVGGRAAWSKFLSGAANASQESGGDGGVGDKEEARHTGASRGDSSSEGDGEDSGDGSKVTTAAADAAGGKAEVGTTLGFRGPPRGFREPVGLDGPNKGPAGAFAGNRMWRLAGGAGAAASRARVGLAANGHGGYSNPLAAMRVNVGANASNGSPGLRRHSEGSGPVSSESAVMNPLLSSRGAAPGSIANPLSGYRVGRASVPGSMGVTNPLLLRSLPKKPQALAEERGAVDDACAEDEKPFGATRDPLEAKEGDAGGGDSKTIGGVKVNDGAAAGSSTSAGGPMPRGKLSLPRVSPLTGRSGTRDWPPAGSLEKVDEARVASAVVSQMLVRGM